MGVWMVTVKGVTGIQSSPLFKVGAAVNRLTYEVHTPSCVYIHILYVSYIPMLPYTVRRAPGIRCESVAGCVSSLLSQETATFIEHNRLAAITVYLCCGCMICGCSYVYPFLSLSFSLLLSPRLHLTHVLALGFITLAHALWLRDKLSNITCSIYILSIPTGIMCTYAPNHVCDLCKYVYNSGIEISYKTSLLLCSQLGLSDDVTSVLDSLSLLNNC